MHSPTSDSFAIDAFYLLLFSFLSIACRAESLERIGLMGCMQGKTRITVNALLLIWRDIGSVIAAGIKLKIHERAELEGSFDWNERGFMKTLRT